MNIREITLEKEEQNVNSILDEMSKTCSYMREDGCNPEEIEEAINKCRSQLDTSELRAAHIKFYDADRRIKKEYSKYAGYLSCIMEDIRILERKMK